MSHEDETHSPMRGDLMKLMLLELLQNQNEQIQRQNEQLQRMVEARERALMEDNLHIFKKLPNHNPPTYDNAPNPKVFENLIQGLEKLFNALQCP